MKYYKIKLKKTKAQKKIIKFRLIVFARVGYAKGKGWWVGGGKRWTKKSFVNKRRYWKKNGCLEFKNKYFINPYKIKWSFYLNKMIKCSFYISLLNRIQINKWFEV